MHPLVEPQAPPASAAAVRAEFSGAEIEGAVISTLEEGFRRGAALNTAPVRAAPEETVSLARTRSEHRQRLRDRARGRARPTQAREPTGSA